MTISEEDLRGLSAVEREALLATDADDEDLVRELGTGVSSDAEPAKADATEPAAEGDDTGSDDDAVIDPAATAPAAPAAAPAQVPTQEPAAAQEPASGAAEPDDEPVKDMQPQRATPDDAAEQRKALRAEKNGAMQKLLGGEITQEEYQAVEDGVQDKLDTLVRAEASDMAREQVRMDSMRTDYNKDLRSSLKDLAAAGLDMKANDGAISAEFDRAVRMFAGEAGARGLEDRPGDLAASRDALAEARAYVLRRHGKTAAPAPAPAPAAPAAAPVAPARSVAPPDRSKFPPTLANVPVASDPTVSNEFAHLEGMEGATLERALARLTPDQQERYLA
ncbi:MAG: hypothetical protein I8H71_01190 [Xanthomonadaceae bacterium]|nr:hypothetical protein [Xanthomonadaceae bacterium]